MSSSSMCLSSYHDNLLIPFTSGCFCSCTSSPWPWQLLKSVKIRQACITTFYQESSCPVGSNKQTPILHLSEVHLSENQNTPISHGERQTPPEDGSCHMRMTVFFCFSPWICNASLLLLLLLPEL